MGYFKKRKVIASSAVLAVCVLGFSLTQPDYLSSTEADCNQVEQHTHIDSQCQKQSWSDWLKGESRSAQFHYLDLLELLSRSNDSDFSNSSKKLQ